MIVFLLFLFCMVVGLVLQKISSLSLVLLLSVLGTTSVLANEEINQNPVYKGEVESINEPIIIRYSPLPKSRTIDTSSFSGKLNGRVLDHKTISRGAIEIFEEDKSLKMLISSFTTELINKNKKETINDVKKMTFDISPFGKINDFSLYSPDLTSEELALTKEAMSNMVEEIIFQLPPSGVETDHKFKTNLTLGGMAIKDVGTVLGKTIFNNRQAIVIDYRGPLSSLVINHEKIKGSFDGYSVMDIATGVTVYTEYYFQAKFSHKSRVYIYNTLKTEFQ
ncbi:hypothetical protein [Kiloniella antarctica]|uniref:Uncharacterized protein n=1 Tax=Kiloniella antarctica TaxID=1550907 RepID=A0ABW5BMS9_9PROT